MTFFQILTHYSDSDLAIYTISTATVCFIGYLVIKSYFYNATIETPNSPPTFNLSGEQIETLNKILDRWEDLENVNEDIQTIIGEEVFDRMEQKFETLENKIEERFDDFRYSFDNLINSPFEEFNLLELFSDSIPFCLLALIIVFAIKYLIFRYFERQDKLVFTNGISTDVITFTRDYQEVLTSRLGNNTAYFITYEKTYYHILSFYWTIFDIKSWLESLNDADYAITIELIFKKYRGFIYK